jgi:Mg/Co/Ni transporter MgtE
MGFRSVADLVPGKAAWLAEGLPSEGLLGDDQRAAAIVRADVPRVAPGAALSEVEKVVDWWELAAVTAEDGTLVGVVRAEATAGPGDRPVDAVMQTGAATVRPSISRRELAQSMDDQGQAYVLVTTSGGRLLGLARRRDL